ncbi:hypothetical protein SMKC056_31230 [Serratia marcescens]|nr:hypothetical protein SMKC056_31230 [Serratia marcescens]
MTLTTERLREIAEDGFLEHGDAKAMARELLANREAQPVGKAEITKIAAELVRGDYLSKLWTEAEKSRHVDTHRLQNLLDELHDVMKVKAIAITQLLTAPPAPAKAQPVAWEMRYWNSGYNIWGEWERITEEHHAKMNVRLSKSNDYEFRVLYDAPPAPAVPDEETKTALEKVISENWRMRDVLRQLLNKRPGGVYFNKWEPVLLDALNAPVTDACRAAMLAQPVSSGYTLPPHVYRELVNSLRDTAVKFSDTEQLRERLNTALSQFIEPDHPHTRTVAPEGGNGA